MRFIKVQPNSSGGRGEMRINIDHIIAYEPVEGREDQLSYIYLIPSASEEHSELEVRATCQSIDAQIKRPFLKPASK